MSVKARSTKSLPTDNMTKKINYELGEAADWHIWLTHEHGHIKHMRSKYFKVDDQGKINAIEVEEPDLSKEGLWNNETQNWVDNDARNTFKDRGSIYIYEKTKFETFQDHETSIREAIIESLVKNTSFDPSAAQGIPELISVLEDHFMIKNPFTREQIRKRWPTLMANGLNSKTLAEFTELSIKLYRTLESWDSREIAMFAGYQTFARAIGTKHPELRMYAQTIVNTFQVETGEKSNSKTFEKLARRLATQCQTMLDNCQENTQRTAIASPTYQGKSDKPTQGSNNQGSNNNNMKKGRICYACGGPNHMAKDCRRLNAFKIYGEEARINPDIKDKVRSFVHNRQENTQGAAIAFPTYQGKSDKPTEGSNKQGSNENKGRTCYACGGPNHVAEDCRRIRAFKTYGEEARMNPDIMNKVRSYVQEKQAQTPALHRAGMNHCHGCHREPVEMPSPGYNREQRGATLPRCNKTHTDTWRDRPHASNNK